MCYSCLLGRPFTCVSDGLGDLVVQIYDRNIDLGVTSAACRGEILEILYPPLLGYALCLHFKGTGGDVYSTGETTVILLARLARRLDGESIGLRLFLGDLIRCAAQRLLYG